MKITPKGGPDSVKASHPAQGSARSAPPAPAPAGGDDLVRLSALATGHITAGEAPFNAEQVERIKQAIRDGEFTVNAEVVAERLLEIESGLVRRRG